MFPRRYRSSGAGSLFCVGIYKDLAPPEPFFNPAAAGPDYPESQFRC